MTRRTGLALALVLALAAFLRFYQLGSSGYGNLYYAATVKSMLTSPHNFFYAAFEPGGSVSVDKPPLAFWVQAASVQLFGLNGFALALPQALAGVISVALLYGLLRRPLGEWPALVAALALAILPITVATERNNTMDGQLILSLLLAMAALLRALRTGHWGWLLCGAAFIGLGFNIKMVQSYMVLPAFYAVYWVGARLGWRQRLAHLALATIVLLVVSFSWVLAFDLTPADQRPYAGSSTDNSMLQLVLGHNGVSRLLGEQPANPPQSLPPQPRGRPGPNLPPQPPLPPQGAAPTPISETGHPGLLRLFRQPLIEQVSWLLPAALVGLGLGAWLLRRTGWQSETGLHLWLWGGWLLPCLVFFSFTGGIFHAYYVVMLGPPIAALCGVLAWALRVARPRLRWAVLLLLTVGQQGLHAFILWQYPAQHRLLLWLSLATLFGVGLLAVSRHAWQRSLAVALLVCGWMGGAFSWALAVTFDSDPNTSLPTANRQQNHSFLPPRSLAALEVNSLMQFLLENANPQGYLLATVSAQDAAPFILATGRPVLTFGGFSGNDPIVDGPALFGYVERAELRFVLSGFDLPQRKPELQEWLVQHCQLVTLPGFSTGQNSLRPTLFDCAISP